MSNNIPYVDNTKERVTIALGIPMYNELEKGHLHETLDNALAVGFDYIIVLDDGSTDDTWVVLQDYAVRYKNIKVFRNKQNSVIYKGKNRWKFIVDKIALLNPDWVVIRAADQIYSYSATIAGGDNFRKRLTEYYHKGIEMVTIPLAHLWRSRSWYRIDDVWGKDILTHSKAPIWRFDVNYSYKGRETTGTHKGWHHPTSFGYGKQRVLKKAPINKGKFDSWNVVVLHLGHSTHISKVLKFKWSMEAAAANAKNGRSITMPPPDNMPPVSSWLMYDGYKGFYEFNMRIKEVNPLWFPGGTKFDAEFPIPQSLYYTILEYNQQRAKEYLILYEKSYRKLLKNRRV